ncbi:MAG: glycosyltransferase family 39 protein [Chloroflexota bacterium]|nr:glycosyltransferase family 39 protein [Chloroflexota bacterium]
MKSKPSPRLLLVAIVVVYVAIGALYAAFTPAWQVPDEPAHYNYVRALAEGRGLPVIETGDYDQAYLSRLTTEKFPPQLSVDAVEYEDHQPPLYYVLAIPVYLLFDGALLPLRLFSVLFGAALLTVAYGVVRAIFPARPDLALMTTAFIAFIPQHVAMTAGVENDALAELVVGAALWALVTYVGGRSERPWPIGLLLAAALLTKMTAYAVLGVAAIAVMVRWRQERRMWQWAARQMAWMFVPALLLSAPWFARNGLVYGWPDLTGGARHNQVVAGQMRSSEYLALHGWDGLLSRMVRWTFRSFWGQFGWMGVVLPMRIYQALALLSVALLAGFLWWLFDRCRPRLTAPQRAGSLLLLAACLLILLEYLGYNLTFLQHQGRYLFPALIPIGAAAALGLRKLVDVLPRLVRFWTLNAFFTGLAAFDVYCLYRFIIPTLTR